MMTTNLKNQLTYQNPGAFEENRYEKLHSVVFDNPTKASKEVANSIADIIRKRQKENKKCVLGLATGSTPISVYRELIRLHQEEQLSFSNVITFNLDEYFPIDPKDAQSYHYFMHENLFDHIDIPAKNINLPKGMLNAKDVRTFCKSYEKKIEEAGGLDVQILGIGRTGHIGFNEPGSNLNSQTRLITLDHLTRYDAAKAFQGIENVPRKAITMGIQTILKARRILLMAWGSNKSDIIQKAIEGKITPLIPTTYLQLHKNTTIVLDQEAASELTRIKTPWLVGSCQWSEENKAKAVVWLCNKTQKSVLKLTDADYNHNGMADLIAEYGSSYELNIEIFNRFQNAITGWPGGKPNADDSKRPERKSPHPKRVIIFSPHPDDDVISMGGTFDRLVSQGHEVHIAYQTSGNIAVSDAEALKFLEVTHALFPKALQEQYTKVLGQLNAKKINQPDPKKVRKLKGLIRRYESLGATRFFGLPDEQVHFLDSPFYETGRVTKNPISQADIDIAVALISEIKPHQIYAAGDLADPHGTHRVCLDIVFAALQELKIQTFMDDCWVWLYRGAWHEWEMHEIEMAVPMSPNQVLRKRKAIFFHESQKDGVMFQGNDDREFWVRAEERNAETAHRFRILGLSDYQAIEAFKRYHF